MAVTSPVWHRYKTHHQPRSYHSALHENLLQKKLKEKGPLRLGCFLPQVKVPSQAESSLHSFVMYRTASKHWHHSWRAAHLRLRPCCLGGTLEHP